MFWASVGTVLALALYLLPTMVAAGRRHRSSTAIAALNILLGWTLLGWVAALVWALTGQPAPVAAKQEAQTRCPECRELILVGARRCKHCGASLSDGAALPPPGMRACPDCHRHAPLAESYCPSCGHNMAPV